MSAAVDTLVISFTSMPPIFWRWLQPKSPKCTVHWALAIQRESQLQIHVAHSYWITCAINWGYRNYSSSEDLYQKLHCFNIFPSVFSHFPYTVDLHIHLCSYINCVSIILCFQCKELKINTNIWNYFMFCHQLPRPGKDRFYVIDDQYYYSFRNRYVVRAMTTPSGPTFFQSVRPTALILYNAYSGLKIAVFKALLKIQQHSILWSSSHVQSFFLYWFQLQKGLVMKFKIHKYRCVNFDK